MCILLILTTHLKRDSPSFCFLRPTEAFLFALSSVLLAILLIFFSNQAEERYKTRCIGRGDGSSLVFHCQVSVQSFAENWLSKFSAWYLQSLNLEKQQTMRRGKWFSCCVVSCWNLGGVHLAIGVWLFGPLRWKHVKNLWPVRCIFPRRNLDLGVQSCDPF